MKEITFKEVKIDQKFWFADEMKPEPYFKVDNLKYRPKYSDMSGFEEPRDFPKGEMVLVSDGVNESICEFIKKDKR